MQIDRGAAGICTAKLGEAEVMAAAGVTDILITTEIVGPRKIERLIALVQQATIGIVVDDAENASQLSAAAVAAGIRLRTFIDVDVGQHRTGIAPREAARALAALVGKEPGLIFGGLQGYDGHLQHVANRAERIAENERAMGVLCETAQMIETYGMPVPLLTTAGSGTAEFVSTPEFRLEIQPGSYTVMDAQYAGIEGVTYEHALSILATVISVHDDRVIVDVGHKAASADQGPPAVLGSNATYVASGDEHGTLRGAAFPLGAKVALIPGHCDPTINLYDEFVVVRDKEVVGRWPVAARGRGT
jgi:D-serine deaminase-like pyridoxal phosphate-dependent protein